MRPRISAAPHWALLLSLLLLNGYIVLRLFLTEYHDHMGSIEGAFVAMATYFREFGYTAWWPWWYGGYPTPMLYPPGLHLSVAWVSSVTGWSAALSYHRLTALTYCLGALTFYALLWQLTRSKIASWCGGVLLSVASPSPMLLASVSGGFGNWRLPRRFEAMAVWGEGPNITGLMLLSLALTCLWWALESRKPMARVLAVLTLASVPLVNWPATIALALAVPCLLMARERFDRLRSWVATIGFSIVGYALISPLLPPSAVLHTLTNAHEMGGRPDRNAAYYLGWYAALLSVALLAWMLNRWKSPAGLRFFALYTFVLTQVLVFAEYLEVNLLPQALRFHLAWEFAIIGLAVTAVHAAVKAEGCMSRGGIVLISRRERGVGYGLNGVRIWLGRIAIAAVVLLAIIQTPHYRTWVRGTIQEIDIRRKVEYQTATWFRRATPDEPVFTLGSIEFWMNAFTPTPQVIGCCEQSVINPVYRAIGYVMGSDDGTNGKESEISLLWLKTTGARAAWIGGDKSREVYHDYRHPGKFDYFELAWQDGDDKIFWIPKRQPGYAHVVRAGDLIGRQPENGIDVEPLRPYVAALDDPSLPLVQFEQPDPDTMRAKGNLARDHVVSFQMNYHSGWRAEVNGHPSEVKRDGMGYLYVEPRCEGKCEVVVRFTGGKETWMTRAASVLALIGLIGMGLARPKRDAPAAG